MILSPWHLPLTLACQVCRSLRPLTFLGPQRHFHSKKARESLVQLLIFDCSRLFIGAAQQLEYLVEAPLFASPYFPFIEREAGDDAPLAFCSKRIRRGPIPPEQKKPMQWGIGFADSLTSSIVLLSGPDRRALASIATHDRRLPLVGLREVVDSPETPNYRVSASEKEGVSEVIESFSPVAVLFVCPASTQDDQSRGQMQCIISLSLKTPSCLRLRDSTSRGLCL